MSREPGILVVGRSTLDLLVRGVTAPAGREELGLLEDYELLPGGSGLNTALALSYLGVDVAFATRVGRDAAGRLIRELIEERGILPARLVEDPLLRSPFSLITVAGDGEIGLLHHEGASRHLNAGDVSEAALRASPLVLIAGAMFMAGFDGAPSALLAQQCRRDGKRVALSTCRNTGRAGALAPVLPHLDLIFLNRKEALEISGRSDHEAAARWFRERGTTTVAVTLGAAGAFVASSEFSGLVEGFKVHAVDTTGCGDAFVAGFLHGTLCGLGAEPSAFWGNVLGAHCARTLGAVTSPFDPQEMAAMIDTHRCIGPIGALVLAGGRSQRMEGTEQKLTLSLCGRTLVSWIIAALRHAGVHRIVVLLGHQADAVRTSVGREPVEFFKARDFALGTGRSVRTALQALTDLPETILVTNGDTPLLRPATLRSLVRRHCAAGAGASAYTAVTSNPQRYAHGLIHRDASGGFSRVEHFREGMDHPPAEVNTGIYSFRRSALLQAVETLAPAPDGEEHLSDVLSALQSAGHAVQLVPHSNFSEFISANTRRDLAEVGALLGRRLDVPGTQDDG